MKSKDVDVGLLGVTSRELIGGYQRLKEYTASVFRARICTG